MRAEAQVIEDDRLSSIETIRGGAAIAVAWYHLTNTYAGPARAAGALGWLGVDCFFVVSGFVIPLSLLRIGYTLDRFPVFVARRLIRLEPPYLISIVLVIALQRASERVPGFAGHPIAYAPLQIVSHIFYLVPFTGYAWIDPVYWSLAYEFAFYLAAGLMFPMLWRHTIVVALALTGLVAILLLTIASGGPPRVPLFLMGFAAMRRHTDRDSWPVCGVTLAASAFFMAYFGGALSASVGAATAIAITAGGRTRAWPVARLGRLSYALYLTHVPIGGRIVNLGRRFVTAPWAELCLSLAALVGCLVVAAVFHRIVEKPCENLSKRWGRRLRGRIGPRSRDQTDAAPADGE